MQLLGNSYVARESLGTVPLVKKISSVCSKFLLCGGTIHCRVITSRQYSGSLFDKHTPTPKVGVVLAIFKKDSRA